jgi:FtsP/CotA-like multicopper oxidase with cupredoxin domain
MRATTAPSKARMSAGLLAAVVLATVLGAAAAQPSSSSMANMNAVAPAATTTPVAAAPAATTPAPAMAAPAKDDTLMQPPQKKNKPMDMAAPAPAMAMAMPAASEEAATPNNNKKTPPPPSSLPLPGALAMGGDEQESMGGGSMATTMPTKTTPTETKPAKNAAAAPKVSCPDLPPPPRGTRRFALVAAPVRSGTNPLLARTQSLAYNGTAVGPLIRVRKGDTVQVDVTNKGIAEGTSVHWHGLDLKNAAWADGVAAVSQRPIPDGSTFSYRFVAEPAGTFWYHSHTGGQYADGLRGPLIVDAADDGGDGDSEDGDPHLSLYDHDLDEHVLMLADVFRTTSEEQLAELQRGGMGGSAEMRGVDAAESMMGVPSTPKAPSGKMAALCDPEVLNQDISDAPWYGVQVNGEGAIAAADDAVAGKNGTMTAKTTFSGAPLVLTVERGQRYRFRLIGGMSSWALKVNFTGGHQFDVIALDGRPIEPKRARALILTSGERADVVLKADRPIGNYWLDFSTLDGNNSPAILHYKGAPDPFGPKGEAFMRTMRLKLPQGCASAVGGQAGLIDPKNATGLSAAAGAGLSPPPAGPADKAYTIYLADASSSVPPPSFLKHIKSNGSNIHGFSLRNGGSVPTRGPSCPPLDGNGSKNETSKYCWSLNWNVYEPPVDGTPLIFGSPIPSQPAPRTYNIDVEQGAVVDLVLLNPSLMVHPMHLHGTGFWVLGTGNGLIVDGNDRLVPSKAKLNLRNPPVRDTVPVAQAAPARPAAEDGETELSPSSYGYAVVRFKADNPGPWAFHCHIELHASAGMFLTFTVHPSDKGEKALASSSSSASASSSSSSSSPPWVVPKNLDCDAGYAARALREEEQDDMDPSTAPAVSSTANPSRRAGVAIAAAAAAAVALALAA